MSLCNEIHEIFNSMRQLRFPFADINVPMNGIYILFQNGEKAHGADRIVRIGTHTGANQLIPRLKQHFINENKDRSIFRKNIGRSLLNQAKDSFLEQWEIDMTTKEAKDKYKGTIDPDKLKDTERKVTEFLQKNFSFVVFRVDDKDKRLKVEARIISTVSLCEECLPSKDWLGNFSPVEKIRESGLWLVNELYKEPLTDEDISELKSLIK